MPKSMLSDVFQTTFGDILFAYFTLLLLSKTDVNLYQKQPQISCFFPLKIDPRGRWTLVFPGFWAPGGSLIF